jgi:CO/xanthine dehydrogenase FAD-binding subunit
VLSDPLNLKKWKMDYWKHYLLPSTLDEALSLLNVASGEARVVAGGTDLLLEIQQGRRPPIDTLVDVTRIAELQGIHQDASGIYLGSAVRHREIIDSALLREHTPCLVQACELIGGPQVRNVATIGGNVAHALPAGDGSIALLACDAEAEIASFSGRRWEKMERLFIGPGRAAFDATNEILVRFRLPLRTPGEKSAFQRVMRPQGVAIAILNMALWVRQEMEGVIEDIRLAVGPAGPKPLRARMAEDILRGKRLDDELLSKAIAALENEAKVRTSPHRATQEYRQHLLGVLLLRLLQILGLTS